MYYEVLQVQNFQNLKQGTLSPKGQQYFCARQGKLFLLDYENGEEVINIVVRMGGLFAKLILSERIFNLFISQ